MLKPGDIVGPYEIRGFVGQGGMGQVYRAFDPRLERTVALKIIVVPEGARTSSKDVAGENKGALSNASLVGELSGRMLREARAVASLSHPNVVAIYDVGESDGRLYLAMEYVVGSSLRNLVGNAELPLSRRVRWLVDVARALEAAHKAGIIHRDIKPENVMIREDGGVKVLDFGIARRAVSRAPEEQHAVDTVTGGGSIVGTPVYMAPEQIKGGDVDARCDQFAWGVMAYELVVGERPWVETGDILSLVANILTEAPRSIRSKVEGVPSVVEETILRALAKDPAQRFPSMADVADALEPFASMTTGGDRVRVTPRPHTADDPAYAATTRVPTTVSIGPSPSAGTEKAKTEESPRRRAFSLALPLVLLGALGATVYVVKTRTEQPVHIVQPPSSAPRPLSAVPQAESAYKDAMSLWRDGATVKARAALARAIEADPTFAAAHLQLALQQASMNDASAAQASFQSAYEHRHMLLPRDERLLEASEPFIRAIPDVEEWETRMTSAVFQFPRDPELQYYLGRARQQEGDHEGARTAFEAAIRLDDGFIPALAAMAKTERSLGNIAEGLALTDRCIKRSPVAATCVETRFDLLFAAGECTRAKEEATRWGSLEPQSPRPFASLARALHADGAPRPSVEEVLSRRWTLVSTDARKQAEVWDRALLAVLDGDFVRADDLAREFDAGLPHTADSYDHAEPARLRINVLMETDRMKEAAKTARSFLDRMPAWASYAFAPDPSLSFYEPIYRAGEMTKKELDGQRSDWLERERRRGNEVRSARDPWTAWATVYGSFAESREEAAEALSHAPLEASPPGERRGLFVDFALGKAYALVGRWDDANPYLQRVVSSCATFDAVMVIAKARLYLGQAQEAKGDMAAAKASYEKVIETWPKTSMSRTAKRASERLATMTRD
ncbi:MAG: serine/threonine protein kinase [Labilithrix sp.]|nr:serine/threonine protein kinase [Labilithrix sp.]